VKAKAGRERASAKLPDRFMVAVDAAATKTGRTSDEEYIAEWREEARQCGPDLQSEVDKEAAKIAEQYPPSLMRIYVRNNGWGG